MIATESLTKRYGDLTAVDNLNIHVQKGEIYGFLGPNGAGKTTTIMMLLGIVKPTSGAVKLFDADLADDYFDIKRRIGVLSENTFLYEEMTADEYLRFFAELYQVDDVDARIRKMMERVNLYDRRHEVLRGYSKGMKQKLALARTLLHDPEVLILDEPVSSLDPYGIKEVRDILMEENQRGKTIFISSHILSEIERTCHRIGIMHKGRLLAEDTMADLRRRLSEETDLTLELDVVNEKIIDVIKAQPFVVSVHFESQHVYVKTRGDQDYRAKLSAVISQNGSTVLGLSRHEMSLEEAFVTITEQNLSFLTKEGAA